MDITTVPIKKPKDVNFILGQSHFIKSVENRIEIQYYSVDDFERIMQRLNIKV